MDRRTFLSAAAATLASPATSMLAEPDADGADGLDPRARFASPRPLVPIDARAERVVDVAVCTRPFRVAGPRIEVETIGARALVHHYGHGGSGWSLSWGSADRAIALARACVPVHAMDRRPRLAIVGAGAIGLTSALVAQRAGFSVRIYASERPPETRSSNATGVWSPDSRICDADHATPAFASQWEAMARRSWWMYQRLLGLPGDPVEWRRMFVLSDVPFDVPTGHADDAEPAYPHLEARYLADLRPRTEPVRRGAHPFPVPHVRRLMQMTFNLATYQRLLVDDFERAGGMFVTRTFESPRELASLPERVVMNATGYGARALFSDTSLVPVRGQTLRLIPQADVDYGLYWRGRNLAAIPRRDGILVQAQADGDFGNADTRVDRPAADAAVALLATLFDGAAR